MMQIGRICADFRASAVDLRISILFASFAFYLVSVIAFLLLLIAPVSAQEENRAGLVVVHGDGSIVTQCISFVEESISGAELLTRSQLDLSVEASSMGATICRIDGEGCDFPTEACFCQCQGSPCIYWSYWRLDAGEWRYSNVGAGGAIVRNGDVEGWRWGQGTVDNAEAPPIVTFEQVCAEPIQAVEPTTAPINAVHTGSPADGSPLPPTTTSIVAADGADRSVSTDATPTPSTALAIVFVVLVILPAIALLSLWLRSSGRSRGR